MMTLKAVLGTEVSMVCEVVRSVSCFRRGARLSNGKRRTSGPRLEKGNQKVSKLYHRSSS